MSSTVSLKSCLWLECGGRVVAALASKALPYEPRMAGRSNESSSFGKATMEIV